MDIVGWMDAVAEQDDFVGRKVVTHTFVGLFKCSLSLFVELTRNECRVLVDEAEPVQELGDAVDRIVSAVVSFYVRHQDCGVGDELVSHVLFDGLFLFVAQFIAAAFLNERQPAGASAALAVPIAPFGYGFFIEQEKLSDMIVTIPVAQE